MKVGVVIPIGPGHEHDAERAIASVRAAWARNRGPFQTLEIAPVLDAAGGLGRSAARNKGLDACAADWHFLLDADDEMTPGAFGLVDLHAPATFGAIVLLGAVRARNCHPVTRADLFEVGPIGTLSMGFFVRGDLGLRFNESLDVAEDFDYYLRLPSFTKRAEPLVVIGYNRPSAHGPRDGAGKDWVQEGWRVIRHYQQQELTSR